jgi:SAM-dependent methyltransferase
MATALIDKRLLRTRLRRAHRHGGRHTLFLIEHVTADLVERLSAIERRFDTVIVHGGQTDRPAAALLAGGRVGRTFRLEATDLAFRDAEIGGAVADEEALPLRPSSIDLFASLLALQWTNDLPGALIQIRQALRPDGLFLAALTGGDTLIELRDALVAAEGERRGGVSPRVLPTVELRDLGALLQRAGFALPVVDRDRLVVRYASAFDLFRDLRDMGAANALGERERRMTGRGLFARAAEIYAERHADRDGRIRATFEIVSLSGWAPHESQQQPARRGSASVSLAAVLTSRDPPANEE